MSKLNLYEIQSQAYAKLKAGATAKDLWSDEYRTEECRQALRHIVGDNPTNDEYNEAIRGMLFSTEGAIAQAKQQGPLAEREHSLTLMSVTLAGSVLRSMMSVEPTTIPEATKVLKDYHALSQQITRELIESCVSHLPEAEQEVYRLDIVRLYGEADEA